MFAEAKLIFQNYIPIEIKKGMLFMSFDRNNQPIVYETNVSTTSKEQLDNFIQANGYPVRPYIYIEGNPNLTDSSYCIATPDKIGWFDRDGQCEDLFDITVREFNIILENDGVLDIEIEEEIVWYDDDESLDGYNILPKEDENGHLVPTLLQGLVTVRFEEEDYDDDDEDDDDEDIVEEYDDTCGYCSGTGMGQYDGSSCRECRGKGFIISKNYDWDDDYYPEND